jgi:DNA-binding transcriptional LysR family regulator
MEFSIEQLNSFRALAETGSFTKAAERLLRTQPAISQTIRSLEDRLGERLFIREGRVASLTPAGRILLDYVNEAFDTLDQGFFKIESLKDLTEGQLTISTSDTTAYYILPDVLMEFRNKYPGIDVRIHCKPSPVSAEQVISREADVGIVTLPLDNPKLASDPLIIREDVVICSPSHTLSGRIKLSLRELSKYTLLLLDRGSNTRAHIDRLLIKENVYPKIVMELGSIEVIKKLVQLNFGISIVPLIALHSELKDNKLIAIRIFKKSECRELGIIYPVKGDYSPAAKEFIKMLKNYLNFKNRL